MKPLLVLPAAGASARMRGRDKLLETIDGVALLRRQALAAIRTGLPVLVTLPEDRPERQRALKGLDLQSDILPDASEGMAASLRHAANCLQPGQSLGLLLPDVPGVTTDDIQAVFEAFRADGEARPWRAGAAGSDIPGTPLFLPHDLARAFRHLKGEETGRGVLKGQTNLLRLDDTRAIRDLDTPEEWAAWRAETGTPD